MSGVRMFVDMTQDDQLNAGGKGSVLSRLKQTRYPVPNGFVILPIAFVSGKLTPEARSQTVAALTTLRKEKPDASFAVRSSATGEDSDAASFAGGFETVLDVKTDDEVFRAIDAVVASLGNRRVNTYGEAKGLKVASQRMAVVVQLMVRAETAGVLFTTDPVSGDRNRLIGNYVRGTGDILVSGEADAKAFSVDRASGKFDGPHEIRHIARGLRRLALRLERALGGPQDIEWAVAKGQIYLLQARPVTTLQIRNQSTGEWNASLGGDYLWTSTNVGEAVPDVMTPLTWSVLQDFHHRTAAKMPDGMMLSGNICGRPYLNFSLMVSIYCAVGQKLEDVVAREGALIGGIPDGATVPVVPLNRWRLLRAMIPQRIAIKRRLVAVKRDLPLYVSDSPSVCSSLTQRIDGCRRQEELLALWNESLGVQWERSCWALRQVTTEAAEARAAASRRLARHLGPVDAERILSVLGQGSELASLGPLLGLAMLSKGQISREDYLAHYGHRGVHEFEISIPRPMEDPTWLDAQLEQIVHSEVSPEELLAKQRKNSESLWRKLSDRNVSIGLRHLVGKVADAAHEREAVRSEMTRCMAVLRRFALRAGELLTIGDGVFFLEMPELLSVLAGKTDALRLIPARRETHRRYCQLPPYPALIRGRFDPFLWGADPARRSDFYDPTTPLASRDGKRIMGSPGASGRIEGLVRKLVNVSQGDQLQPGEILVTSTINIGWTLLFPRAAAIVTDVGAPLSHAAIVARELGIPAVVGCGNATTVLQTGDRVVVDGSRGVVELLD